MKKNCASFLALCLPLLFSGCDLFNSPKKEINRELGELRIHIKNKEWKKAAAYLTRDFQWTASNGRHFQRHGAREFFRSIAKIPRQRNLYFKIISIKRITDQKYAAKVACRFQINSGTSDVDNVNWTARQTWIKGKKWQLAAVVDLEAKHGNRGRSYDTDPKKGGSRRRTSSRSRSTSRQRTSRKSSSTAQRSVGGDVGSFVDYATGYTPLKIKQNAKSRINKLQQQRDSRLKKSLGQ